jgi:hypothetical protein
MYLLQHGAIPISVMPVAPNLGKGKGKASSKFSLDEEEFMKEYAWLVQRLTDHRSSPISDTTTQVVEEGGEDIECGCCFSSHPFVSISRS